MLTEAAIQGYLHGPAKELLALKGVFEQYRKVRREPSRTLLYVCVRAEGRVGNARRC